MVILESPNYHLGDILEKQCRIFNLTAFFTKLCPVCVHPCGFDSTVILSSSITSTKTLFYSKTEKDVATSV